MQSHIIDTVEKFTQFSNMVEKYYDIIDIVAFDLETDSVEEVKANLYGIGIAFEEDEGFYFPIRTKEGELFFKDSTQDIIDFVQKLLLNKRVIGHNIIYDTLVWKKNTGIDISNSIYADTILMKHCLNEEPPFGLKEVSVAYLGEWADMAKDELLANIKANNGSVTKDNMQMFKADTEVLGKYCTWDVMLTYKLFNLFSGMLKEEQLEDFFYKEEVMPLYKEVTIKMKERGFPVDVAYFQQLGKEITIDIDSLELKVMEQLEETVYDFMAELLNEKSPVKKTGSYPKAYAKLIGLELDSIAKKKIESIDPINETQLNFKQWMLGEVELSGPVLQAQLKLYFDKFPDQNYVFNLRSKAHLKRLFFEMLGEKELSTTEGGEPQVDDAFLESVSSKYKWVTPLQDLNKLEKIKGTYIEGILDRQVSGIIYASLLQFGTTSGRYASRNPNLQNLPRVKEEDSGLSELVLHYNNAIRKGFIAPDGYCIVDADYSALEPRCVWEYTKVKVDNEFIHIKDINIGDNILTSYGTRQVTNKWTSVKNKIEILTNYGVLNLSEDHKVFSLSATSWKAVKDLQVGENLQISLPKKEVGKTQILPLYLAVNYHQNKTPIGYMEFTEDLAWGLGAFYGDGLSSCRSAKVKGYKNNAFGYTGYIGICGMAEDGVVANFQKVFNKFGLNFCTWKDQRTASGIMQQSISTSSSVLSLFMETFKVAQPKDPSKKFGSKNMHIPLYILNSPIAHRVAFLAGLIDTDGTIRKGGGDATIATAVPQFANDIVRLVESLGLYARITYTVKDKKHFGCQVRLPKNTMAILELNYSITSYMQCRRKGTELKQIKHHKIKHTPCEIKYIIKTNQIVNMIDIEVAKEHEFLAENHRVHNCFAHMSTDKNLQLIFHSGEDMYSAIAKRIFNLKDVSTFKKDSNFLGKLYPEKRQVVKAMALAVTYGAEAFRIGDLLGVDRDEAQRLIDMYLESYPGLKKYIQKCHYEANNYGAVRTIFGRVRHLPDAKRIHKEHGYDILDSRWAKKKGLGDERRLYKNKLNNSTNFKIQGLAAHIVNRAMVQINREFNNKGVDGWVALQIHDQIACIVNDLHKAEAKAIVQNAMETIVKLDVPLIAEPAIAYNLKESH